MKEVIIQKKNKFTEQLIDNPVKVTEIQFNILKAQEKENPNAPFVYFEVIEKTEKPKRETKKVDKKKDTTPKLKD